MYWTWQPWSCVMTYPRYVMGIMMTVPSHSCIEELGGERFYKITSCLGNEDVFSRQHFATCCTNIVCLAGSSRIHKLEAPTSGRVCFAKWHHSRSLGSLRWSHLPDGRWRLWNFILGNFSNHSWFGENKRDTYDKTPEIFELFDLFSRSDLAETCWCWRT